MSEFTRQVVALGTWVWSFFSRSIGRKKNGAQREKLHFLAFPCRIKTMGNKKQLESNLMAHQVSLMTGSLSWWNFLQVLTAKRVCLASTRFDSWLPPQAVFRGCVAQFGPGTEQSRGSWLSLGPFWWRLLMTEEKTKFKRLDRRIAWKEASE